MGAQINVSALTPHLHQAGRERDDTRVPSFGVVVEPELAQAGQAAEKCPGVCERLHAHVFGVLATVTIPQNELWARCNGAP